MTALDRKLLRDLVRMGPQIAAIALVLACGIMVLVMASGAQRSLTQTRDAYYNRNRFADVFASATRAPRSLLADIAALDGVALVEARIRGAAVLDMPGMAEPASAELLSLPEANAPVLNVPLLRSGRMPDPQHTNEIVVDEPFASANHLHPGDVLRAVVKGQQREFSITGTVLSPEFVYTLSPGSIMPDDQHFALIWMAEAALAASFDLEGAFNDVSLTLTQSGNRAAVIAAVDDILAPYGGTGAIGRDQQPSNAFLDNELRQLAVMELYLPPTFLIVSAVLVNMVLGRLIALERRQIGLLKAVGYSTAAIVTHYMKISVGIGVIGVALGWAAGWGFGAYITRIYADFFRFPFLIYIPGVQAFAISGVLGMATVALGAVRAVFASARMQPAVAMSPPAPPIFRRGWVDAMAEWTRLRQPTMMILRSVTRWPARAAVTSLGVAASVAMLVASYHSSDVLAALLTDIFEHANRQNVTLGLVTPQRLQAVSDAMALPGVRQAEPAFTMPVRIGHDASFRILALQARFDGAQLTRILDEGGRAVAVPRRGLVIPDGLATILRVKAGDLVTVEFLAAPRESLILPVTAIVRQSLGQDVYMQADALFALMRHAPQVNALNLLVDPQALPQLQRQVKTTPSIGGMIDWVAVRRQFEATINASLMVMTLIYTALGLLIALGVIYNTARIQLAERAHELATLRVLGFTRAEVGFVLVGELMLLTALGVAPGWVAGYGFAAFISRAMSSDIVALPLVIEMRSYAVAGVVVVLAALITALVVRRRLDRVDLVSALKQRE